MAGIHAQARLGRLAVGAAAYGGAMDARVERTMRVMGNTILRGDTSPAIFGGRLQASYALLERGGATLAAYGSLDAAQVSRGATAEAVRGIGGNAPGVEVASRDSASVRSEVGLQVTAPVGLSTAVFARAGLASRLSSDEKVSARLAGLPGSGFQVVGAREAAQAAALSGGVETVAWRGARVGARVDARLGDGTSFVAGTARLRWEF